jgi:hypothetical protein
MNLHQARRFNLFFNLGENAIEIVKAGNVIHNL